MASNKTGYNREYYAKNREKILVQVKVYRENNRERIRVENVRRNREMGGNARRSALTQKLRMEALETLYKYHGIRGCMASAHPYISEELRTHSCWGSLWLEHVEGGGGKDRGDRRYREIIDGTRDFKAFMVLCRLHQIWNNPNGRWSHNG